MTGLRFTIAGLGAEAVPYEQAWAEQRRLHAQRVADEIADTCVLLEHPSVYTAGRRTKPEARPVDDTAVLDVDRGGEITWHGPGQLVGYPIVKMPKPIDAVGHVRKQEDALIAACAELGVDATRIAGRSGVWVAGDDAAPAGPPSAARANGQHRKIAAIGVRISRCTTMHGFALNCDADLTAFDRIVPCGIHDAGVTSLSVELGRRVTVADVVPIMRKHLEAAFSRSGRAGHGSRTTVPA